MLAFIPGGWVGRPALLLAAVAEVAAPPGCWTLAVMRPAFHWAPPPPSPFPTHSHTRSPTPPSACTQGDYRIIGSTEIQAEMTKLTGEVASVLDIPPECARTLLIHFRCCSEVEGVAQ